MPERSFEKQLVEACIKGERTAQKKLFELYGRRMMAVCLRYGRHREEAEDMLQDGFIRVFEYLHTFNFQGPLEAWIRRVVVNAALRIINRKSHSHEDIGLPEYYDVPTNDNILAKLSEKEILGYIHQLPDGYRNVFNMYIIEGYSHREISEMLGCQESTSRSQLVKAKKMLQKMILSHQKVAV